MSKIYYLLLVILFFPIIALSQGKSLKSANQFYNIGSYYFATLDYEKALKKGADSLEVANSIANSYYRIGEVMVAVKWYRFLQRQDKLDKSGLFRLALLERQAENYEVSENLLLSYKEKYGDKDFARNYFKHGSVESLMQNKGKFEVLLQNVSSPNSEIGTTIFSENEVMLSSSQNSPKDAQFIDSWRGNYLYDIYRAPLDANGNIFKSWKKLDFGGRVSFNGPAVYNKENRSIYFTRNNIMSNVGIDKDSVFRLKIFRVRAIDDETFGEMEDIGINSDAFSNAHPFVSEDGKRLYFSSDRPGGSGGMDIYYVDLGSNGLPSGNPINMGRRVNTPQDDMFPYYNLKNNMLFFASEGHFGLGGLDIFFARLDKIGQVKEVENIGAPINSPYDDFSFINNESQTGGYFSSNRPGGIGSDDIYKFYQKEAFTNKNIMGTVKNQITKEPLKGVTIYIKDNEGNISDSIKTDGAGEFDLAINEIRDDFSVVASKTGYSTSSIGIAYELAKQEYNGDLSLSPKANYYFTGVVKNISTKEPIEGVKITVKDNKNNESFQLVTDRNGIFKSNTLPYKYEENISYYMRLEKEGYVAKIVDFSKTLELEDKVDINQMFPLELTKIEIGKTDLSDIIEISPIYFDLNSSVIRDDAKIELNKVAELMKENPAMVVELRAHTDSQGKSAYNLKLSDRRAKSSAQYIISQGIEEDRILGKGYGDTRLIVSDKEIEKAKTKEEKEALHQQNRRTEFIIVKMK